jgi:hypothetical protein
MANFVEGHDFQFDPGRIATRFQEFTTWLKSVSPAKFRPLFCLGKNRKHPLLRVRKNKVTKEGNTLFSMNKFSGKSKEKVKGRRGNG